MRGEDNEDNGRSGREGRRSRGWGGGGEDIGAMEEAALAGAGVWLKGTVDAGVEQCGGRTMMVGVMEG